jgi:hypothetical protein
MSDNVSNSVSNALHDATIIERDSENTLALVCSCGDEQTIASGTTLDELAAMQRQHENDAAVAALPLWRVQWSDANEAGYLTTRAATEETARAAAAERHPDLDIGMAWQTSEISQTRENDRRVTKTPSSPRMNDGIVIASGNVLGLNAGIDFDNLTESETTG